MAYTGRREPKLFYYNRQFDEALKRGQIYWPGESIKKFGLQIANIEPVKNAENEIFEWGEIVVLDSDGRARVVAEGDDATNFYGVVHRNATATYGVLSEQLMGMAPRITLSVFKGDRQGVIAMPVQNITDFDDGGDVAVAVGNTPYVRVKEIGDEAPAWSDSTDYTAGQMVKHDDELYIAKEDHVNTSSVEPGEANDWEDTWKLVEYTLPLGGIETSACGGECVEWTNAEFAEKVTFPFKQEKYTDEESPTTAVAGVVLG